MSKINEAAVKAALGEGYNLRVYDNGNIQATIMDLKKFGPYDVCCHLIKGAQALVKAGLAENPNDCVRLSWKTPDKDANGRDIWKPFPQLWINQPSKTQAAVKGNESRLDGLESSVTTLAAAVQAMLVNQQGATVAKAAPAPAQEAPAPMPPETEHPF